MLFNNPIENIMNTTMSNLKNLSDVDTVIGKPIPLPDGSMLIPVSKVSIGFLLGGGEYSESQPKKSDNFPYATGSGAGISVTPIGFLHSNTNSNTFIKTSESHDKWADVFESIVKSIKKPTKNETSNL